MRSILLCASVAGLLAGCVPPSGEGPGQPAPPAAGTQQVTLTGSVAYRERIALDPGARVEVTINDVSRADAPSVEIARTEFAASGRQPPLAFELAYDKAKIDPRGRYAVSARITGADGRLLWISDTHNPLPPAGESIALMLVSARGPR